MAKPDWGALQDQFLAERLAARTAAAVKRCVREGLLAELVPPEE